MNETTATPTLKLLTEWFEGKSKDELRAVEHGNRLLWPDTIKRRGLEGKVIETRCMLRSPTTQDKALAIILANAHCAKLAQVGKGVILTRDQAVSHVGFDAYGELETTALLSLTILEAEPPHAQMYLFPLIASAIPMSSLYEIYDRLDFYSRLEDVRLGDLGEDMIWALVRNVAKVENLSPLLVIAGSERDRFIVSMAVRLEAFRTQQLCSPSSETSTPAASPTPT